MSTSMAIAQCGLIMQTGCSTHHVSTQTISSRVASPKLAHKGGANFIRTMNMSSSPRLEYDHQVVSSLRSSHSRILAAGVNAVEKTRRRTTATGLSDEDRQLNHCKGVEGAVKLIMVDVLQHCLGKQNDVMRRRVLDQVAKGLAALIRVSLVSHNPIPLSEMVDEDIHHVRKLLQLVSLPFDSSSDHDFQRVMAILQGYGPHQGRAQPLTRAELKIVYERLGMDFLQCITPLAMCFPELPLWAKRQALSLPAELAQMSEDPRSKHGDKEEEEEYCTSKYCLG